MDWRLEARCRGEDTEIFFVNSESAKRKAKQVCEICPVRRECLETVLAIERAEPQESADSNLQRRHGIFAGLSGYARWKMVYPKRAAAKEKKRKERRKTGK